MSFDLTQVAKANLAAAKNETDLQAFEELTKGDYTYIPSIKLLQAGADEVKEEMQKSQDENRMPKFYAGNLSYDKDTILKEVKCIPLDWRPCATQFENNTFVKAVYVRESAEFAEIARAAANKMRGFRAGMEFLLWLPEQRNFGLVHYYGTSLKKDAPRRMMEQFGLPTRLFGKPVKSAEFTWHVYKTEPGTFVYDAETMGPSKDFYEKAKALFDNREVKTPFAGGQTEAVPTEVAESKKAGKRTR